MNPIHNRKRLARRIWKRLFAGYFAHVYINYGEGKDFRRIVISKNNDGFDINIKGKVTAADIRSNTYELLLDAVRQADDIKCFGNKFVTKEWNGLCYMKSYSYQKLAFSDCGGCHIIR